MNTFELPFEPPRFSQAASCGGRIGPDPQAFLVEEIPAYELSGEGEHVFVWIEKTGVNTTDVAKRLARAAGMSDRDVGYAGMKDKNAVTKQWFSLCTKDDNAASWNLGDDVRILETTRHGNKLRTGHLIGNRFTITLVGTFDGALSSAQETAQLIQTRGIPNYFGAQRFGRGGQNLSQGRRWLAGLLNAGQGADEPEASVDPSASRRSRKRRQKGGRGKGDRFENKLMPSVLQSEAFNRYVAARLARSEELLLGEVVRLDGAGKSFVVTDVEQELERYRTRDFHLTGPMFGPKTLQAESEALALELAVLEEMGLLQAELTALAPHAPGARRDLMLYPEQLTVEARGERELALSFSLPAGAYATQLIREFCDTPWQNPRGDGQN